MFISVSFNNIFLKSFSIYCLSPGGITVSSPFLEFASAIDLGFTTCSPILFPINSPYTSGFSLTTFLEVVFPAPSPVFVAASNNYLPYLLETFLANNKNLHSSTCLLIFGSVE